MESFALLVSTIFLCTTMSTEVLAESPSPSVETVAKHVGEILLLPKFPALISKIRAHLSQSQSQDVRVQTNEYFTEALMPKLLEIQDELSNENEVQRLNGTLITFPLPNVVFEDGTLTFNEPTLTGTFTYRDLVLSFGNITVDYSIDFLIPIILNTSIWIEQLALRASSYELNLALTIPDSPDPIPITGNGSLVIEFTRPSFDVGLALSIRNDKFLIRSSLGPFGLDSLYINLENFVFGEYPIDWEGADFAGMRITILTLLGLLPIYQAEPILDEVLTLALNECVPGEVVGGDFSCLGLPPPPTGTTRQPVIPGSSGALGFYIGTTLSMSLVLSFTFVLSISTMMYHSFCVV